MANANKNLTTKRSSKNGRKRNPRKFDREYDNSKSEKQCIDGPNDLSWYVVSDQILNDAARIPYSIPVGMSFHRRGTFTPSGITLPAYDDAIPGIMASFVMPCLGNAQEAGDAVNVAANSVYQFVRSKISGSRPYDAVDMMVYLGAMDSLFCLITWYTRLFGTVYTYHEANRYLSRALVEAQGVDYDDLVANIAQFRASVNLLIAKVRSLYLPAILPIFKRHSWLFSHYYIEGDSEKDQIYFHVPAGCYHFKYDTDGAGMLEAYNIYNQGAGPITTTGLINLLENLINPIYADEDFNRISGDFLKAYEGNVFTLTEIADISTVELLYSEEVLLQFKNAKYKYVNASGDRFAGNFFDYKQDTTKTFLKMSTPRVGVDSYIVADATNNAPTAITSSSTTGEIATLSAEMYDWSKPTLLSSPHHDVVPGETMINTRLTLAFNIDGNASGLAGANWSKLNFGTEWPVEYRLYCYHRSISTNVTSLFFRRYDAHMCIGFSNVSYLTQFVVSQVPIRTAFKYLPELSLIVNQGGTPNVILDPGRSLFEVDNYALVDANAISGLHNAAILGEYNIPRLSLGK